MDRFDQLLSALIEAEAHVTRQQFAGKHMQDRVDAEDWVTQWGSLVRWAREQPRQPTIPLRGRLAAPKLKKTG
jgi:hypothetical protein